MELSDPLVSVTTSRKF